MISTATLKWLGLALLGIAIAAGVAIAAGNLAGQQIGLSSESISAGDALAPVARSTVGHRSAHSGKRTGDGRPTPTAPATTRSTPAPQPETPTAVEAQPPPREGDDSHGGGGNGDSGGSGSGGHGADD